MAHATTRDMDVTPDLESAPRDGLLFARFDVLEELGAGGFGRVLRCYDCESGSEVALKELHRFDAPALASFKNEFRALSDVVHPNLVRLGELFVAEGKWAFSLEYVPGHDFLSWVRPDGLLHEDRLRAGLVQLVHGLEALHSLGLLHRDVKPLNVRVTPEGRVVLLDFGLVAQLGPGARADAGVGTVAYMAPEQAESASVTPAVDWYALGVLLYESLTGGLPFEGAALRVLLDKRLGPPPSPRTRAAHVAADLDALCMGLLHPEPSARLDGRAVLAGLAATHVPSRPPVALRSLRPAERFLGRGQELSRLHDVANAARSDGPRLVLIEGESGIGKSTLMHRFVDEVGKGDAATLVLSGRCHAAEQLAYKAFDGVVDALANVLSHMDDAACGALLPERPELLTVLFPALRTVRAIERADRRAAPTPRADRFGSFQAFATLLSALAASAPLVLAIDDLQWSDIDSLVLLEHLLESRSAPRMLIVATVRPFEQVDDGVGAALRALLRHTRVERVVLGALIEADLRALGAALLERDPDDELVAAVSKESAGHPLFLVELAVRARRDGTDPREVSDLDGAVLERIARLDPVARLVVELLAIEGAPVPQRVLASAASAPGDVLVPQLAALRVGRLIRPTRRAEFVCYHDRFREAVLSALPHDTRRELHQKLAEAWQGERVLDPARLAQHWLAIDDVKSARPWIEAAALQAENAAAFERAAEHYRTLLTRAAELLDPEQTRRARVSLADALARSGRYVDSAREFTAALDGADAEERADLFVRSAQQLLHAADVQAGLEAAKHGCEAAGLSWPSGSASALTRLLWHRLCLASGGLDVTASRAREASPTALRQLDILWRLAQPIVWVDLARGAELIARHLRLALRTGSARHIALGLWIEATIVSMQRPDSRELSALRAAAAEWTRRADTPDVRAYGEFCEGTIALFLGQPAAAQLERAERAYREHCPGEPWLLTNTRASWLGALVNEGQFREAAALGAEYAAEARSRGDLFALTSYTVVGAACVRHLFEDRPERALVELDEAMQPWRATSFGVQHLGELMVSANVLLYQGGDRLSCYLASASPKLRRSFVTRFGQPAEALAIARAGGELRAAFAEPMTPDAEHLRKARHLCRALRRHRTPFGRGVGALFRAQLALFDGDTTSARTLIAEADATLRPAGYFMAELCSVLAAALEGTQAMRAREAAVAELLSARGVTNPARMLEAWIPVLPALRD